jgi:hypothetical protein
MTRRVRSFPSGQAGLWLCLAALSAAGCRDLKADPGFCADCPADSVNTRDAQAASAVPAADGGRDAGSSTSPSMPVVAGHDSQPTAAVGGALGSAGNLSSAGGSPATRPSMAGAGGGSAGAAGTRSAPAGAQAPPLAGAGGHAGAAALPCGGRCVICEESTQSCLQCSDTNTTQCGPELRACKPDHTCVQCSATDHSACTGKTPVCDVAAYKCVACTAQDHGACSGDKPLCDVSHNSCVQCSAASHAACSGDKPICDPVSQSCVPCLGNGRDSSCPNGMPVCSAQKCVECAQSADCPLVQRARCDVANHSCAACSDDGDCQHLANTPVCDLASGICEACTQQSEATRCPGEVCMLATHTCAPKPTGTLPACSSCSSDSQCGPGLACVAQTVEGRNVGNFCLNDQGGCGGAASNAGVCTASGKCSYSCTADSDCPAHERCVMKVCE